MNSPKSKIESKLKVMTADELFELMRGLVAKTDDASFVIYELACDIYMSKVPDNTFCQAMDILDGMLD